MTEQLEPRTLLTAFIVDSFFDTVDQNPGDMAALDATGQTSLRAAIMEANAVAGFDTITLGGGLYNLSLEGTDEDSAVTGDLDVSDDLFIQGESAQTTIIDARDLDRVFEVRPGATLQLSDLTITGGDLAGRGDGGGIRVDNGILQLNNVVIIGNRASNGGGIHNNLGTVTLNNTTLAENRAEGMPGIGQGGAIDSLGGTVIIQQSTLHDNFALVAGGGIASSADTLGGSLSVENSTIAQNNAGDFQPGQGDGGGLYIQAGVNATALASTIAFNSAGNEGGGVWLNGSLTLERTILGNNITSGTGPEGFINGGSVTSNGFNLVREDTDFNFATTTGDQIGTLTTPIDPNLLGLADNGGPTLTIALGGMSPAIDAGPMIASPLFADQRGFDRERDGDRNSSVVTDIGAFELQSPSDFFVDDIGTGVISGGRAGDYAVTTDNGVIGMLDAGDFVTFDPDGQPIFNVEFGVRAFGTINDALTRVRMGTGDSQNEIVLGAGGYTGSLNLDINGLTLRGHTGNPTDVVIDGGGAATAVSVTEDSVALTSLRVTNAITGIDVAPMSSAQFFDADNIRVDGTTDGLKVFDSIGLMQVSIQNSTFSNNSGNGVNITNVGSAFLRNIFSTMNGQDGVEVVNTPIVGLDTVTVAQNSGRGLVVDGADTIAVMDPRTSASTNGNVFSNSPVVLFRGVAGDVANSTTVTDTEIQFDAGMGFTQESISLTNVDALFVSGDGGNDLLSIDYSAGNPPSSRQLFLDAGPGNDTILSINDADQELTRNRLTIGGIDDVSITGFEQAIVTGGAGNNKLDATSFEGPVTLSGLSGNDTLLGSAADDVLDGGTGDDFLGGGPLHEQYVLGSTVFESLDLVDSDMDVTTILDETDTDVATIDLMGNVIRFNDTEYSGNSLFVAPSGVASFHGPVFPQNNFDLTDAPNTIGGVPIIAPLFDDWVTGLTGVPGFMLPDSKVLFKFQDLNADTIDDRLIVEWNEVYHRDQIDMMTTPVLKPGASPVTFQMILELNTFDRDGDITFNYVDLDTGTGFAAIADGASATIGGKDGGDHAAGVEQFSFNALNPQVGSNQAIVGRSAESDGDDLLTGGSGDDILFSTSGVDSLDGGAGANDRLVFAGLNNDSISDHTINGLAIESRIFEDMGRFYDFKTSYSNIESLDVGFGPSDQNVLVELDGLPASVSLDTRGPSASDSVTISGTTGDDTLTLSGTTLSSGTTSVDLAGVEDLTLDISSGGADSISIDQDFTGSARSVMVTGDLADDAVSLQSTIKPQQASIFTDADYIVQIQELLGGDLVLEEVLSNLGDDGDGNTIADQEGPDQVLVSPDGTRVYVAASDSDALIVYDRDRVTGNLTFIESLANSGMDSFGNMISGLDGASNVIVSADGRNVYVASEIDRTIAFFVRQDGDDQLTFVSSTVVDTAGNPVNIDLPSDMAFIPDGSVLMVTSESLNRIDFLEVNGSGDLTFQGSLVDGGSDSAMTMIDGIGGASSIAVSPDGRFMYVTGATDNAIAVFNSPTDDPGMGGFPLPLFVQKLADSEMDASLNIVSGIVGASSVEISPDGQHVYVTGESSNSIAVFSRDAGTGELTFVESLAHNDLDSMSNTVENLLGPVSVSISPEGKTVYVAASGSNAVTLFNRDITSGSLTFLESLANGALDGAGTIVAGVTDVSSVVASTDGQHVYASGTGDDAIVRFNVPRLLNVSTDGAAAISITTNGADDTIALSTAAQPSSLTIDSGGSADNDTILIQGTTGDDAINVNGGTVTFGPTTLTVANVEGLNLFTDAGDDTVNVTASGTGPAFFLADGGPQNSTDILNVDAQTQQASDSGSNITFTGGLQPVSYGDFETVAITNAAPTIDDDTFVVPENAPIGTTVGTASGSDPETGESLVYRILSGNTGNAFSISASTGEISVNAALDFETLSSYALVVEVEDQQSLTDTATVTIIVADVKPTISNQSFNVPENQPNGTSVGTVVLDAGDMNSVVFSIVGGNTGSAFAINSSTGEITIANTSAIDFESRGGFPLLVQVTDDGGTTTDSATVSMLVQDVNEAPFISPQTFSVDENSPVSTAIGAVIANDPETPSGLTFSITAGDPIGLFSINSSTGALSVGSVGLNHELDDSFDLTVQVTDPGMLSASAAITININDLNEPPILDPVGDRLAVVDQALTFTATATDPDAPPSNLTFSLGSGAPPGASITTDGDFTFTPTMTQDGMSFTVTLIVTEDTGGLMASETILISVSSVDLDFGDAPSSFRTLFSDDGPRHIVGPLFLGTQIDAEAEGLPSVLARGDDNDSSLEVPIDDEDGITFLSALNVGRTRQFRVLTSAAGFLDSWIDFDQDGVFAANENLSPSAVVIANGGGPGVGGFTNGTGIAVPAGFSTISFDIPNSAAAGLTYARFRFSSTGGLTPMGLASDGEVEDYRVEIIAPPPGNSSSIEPALDTAVDGFFDAFPDELNDPDPTITGDELPLAVQAENGAKAERRNGAPPLNQTDPALRTVVQAINEAVDRLEQNRAPNENILVIATHPVDFLLTDTQGRSVGFTQAAGTINEIGDDATFTGDGVVELLTIRNADPGEYTLQLVGVGGVFRGGASLLTPAGTQQITFQGSLAQNDDVQLALTYQEGLLNIPSRSDLDDVNFSEIADLVAQIPVEENNAATLAAGATEALASIALDRLDASVFSRKDDDELSLQQLLKQLSETHQRLLDAIETSLDDDELEELKRVFGDAPENEDNVAVLTRVLLETLSGPLISVPRQVDDLSGSLQQLLEQLREQQQNRPANRNNQQVPNSSRLRDAARPEGTDNRTSQRSSESKSQISNRSTFIAGNNATETIREPGSQAPAKHDDLSIDAGTGAPARPKFLASKPAEAASNETLPEESTTTE